MLNYLFLFCCIIFFCFKLFIYFYCIKKVAAENTTTSLLTELGIGIEPTNGPRYELRSVVLHKGISVGGGHYITDVYDSLNSKWSSYNDSVVKEVIYFIYSFYFYSFYFYLFYLFLFLFLKLID